MCVSCPQADPFHKPFYHLCTLGVYLTGDCESQEPPLLKLSTHPYFRKKYLVQGVLMLVVHFLVVTILGSWGFSASSSRQPLKGAKSLHHSTKSYFTQLPRWENPSPMLWISFFPFWIENPGENSIPGLYGWSCGEMQLQWWPRRWWWIDTDDEGKGCISLPLQLQGHRDFAKGHEQVRKVTWGKQNVLERLLPLSSKWNIMIQVALCGMGIVKRTCWIKGWQHLGQVTFFFFKEELNKLSSCWPVPHAFCLLFQSI